MNNGEIKAFIETYKNVKENSKYEFSGSQILKIVKALEQPTIPTFPEGTTNGDMFMLTYPTSIVAPNKERGLDVTVFLNEAVIFKTWFPITWWNAPYKRGNENDR